MTAVGRVAALGEFIRVQGFALAGALVFPAEDAEAVRTAWRRLPRDVAMVVVTPAAETALGALVARGPAGGEPFRTAGGPGSAAGGPERLVVVMPP